MSYALRIARPAEKVLESLDAATESRVRARFDDLMAGPYDPRFSKPLVEVKGLRAARVGEWRILYTVDDRENVIYVTAIRHRGESYRRLNR